MVRANRMRSPSVIAEVRIQVPHIEQGARSLDRRKSQRESAVGERREIDTPCSESVAAATLDERAHVRLLRGGSDDARASPRAPPPAVDRHLLDGKRQEGLQLERQHRLDLARIVKGQGEGRRLACGPGSAT